MASERLVADLGGIAVAVEAPDGAMLAPFKEVLTDFPKISAERAEWRVLLSPRPGLPPSERLPARAEGTSPEGLSIVTGWRPGGRQLLVEGKLGIRVCERRRLVVCRCGDAPELVCSTAGIAVVDAILEASGQYLQHAALLSLPPALRSREGPGGLLLFGESGTGKSTTALALARGGWALGADDACVLRGDPEAVNCWSFPRACKVHRQSLAMMPWLEALLPEGTALDENEETAMGSERLARAVALLDPPLVPLPVRGLCWLGARSDGGHKARALSASEAVLRLSAEALNAPMRRLDDASRGQFDLFARMVRQTPWRYELSLGRDLGGLPAWLEQLFEARGTEMR